jgi:hypothetical protein
MIKQGTFDSLYKFLVGMNTEWIFIRSVPLHIQVLSANIPSVSEYYVLLLLQLFLVSRDKTYSWYHQKHFAMCN